MFQKIDKNFLKNLEINKIPESNMLEYKLYRTKDEMTTDQEKNDIIKEIIAFSNAFGGKIIIGIDDSTYESIGVEITDGEFELYVDSMTQKISSKIQPRIQVGIESVDLEDHKKAIIFDVPLYYNGPHAMLVGSDYRYYYRNNKITETMSPDQMKQFFKSNDIEQKIFDFRSERIRLLREEHINNIEPGKSILLLQVVPYNSFNNVDQIDLINEFNYDKILPMNTGFNKEFNEDGVIKFYPRNGYTIGYLQIFKNGIFEVFNSNYMNVKNESGEYEIYNWEELEIKIYGKLEEICIYLQELNIPKPWMISISLIDVKGKGTNNDNPGKYRNMFFTRKIDRPEILVEVTINEGEDRINVLKPKFDVLAKCFGTPVSLITNRNPF